MKASGMGVQELLIVFAILLLFFGAKKLPDLAGSLGTSIRMFRKAAESPDDDDRGTEPAGERHPSAGSEGPATPPHGGPAPADRDPER